MLIVGILMNFKENCMKKSLFRWRDATIYRSHSCEGYCGFKYDSIV
uniref:Uncharacterized protein n=1 Tax=Ascaris lumbricoides TaxID=6252 RepID=A0A0M3IVQ5_ASCLU